MFHNNFSYTYILKAIQKSGAIKTKDGFSIVCLRHFIFWIFFIQFFKFLQEYKPTFFYQVHLLSVD